MMTAPPIGHPLAGAAAFDAPVAGVPTRFFVAPFSDVTFVAASQTGAVGTLLRVTPAGAGEGPAALRARGGGGGPDDGDPSPPPADVATLTGRRGVPALEACARALAARRGARGRPLLLSLALADDSPAAVRGVLAALDGRL
jgi:hypothetical protein